MGIDDYAAPKNEPSFAQMAEDMRRKEQPQLPVQRTMAQMAEDLRPKTPQLEHDPTDAEMARDLKRRSGKGQSL